MFWKPCSGKFAWLGNHPSLANQKGASVEVAKARFQYCFSKLCCNLAHLSTGLCSKGSCLRIIYNFGTASYQMHSCKLVLNDDCVVHKHEAAKL